MLKLIIFSVLFSISLFCKGQDTGAIATYDLSALVDQALSSNGSLKYQKLQQDQQSVELNREKSKYLPQINGYANYLGYLSDIPLAIFPNTEGSILSNGSSQGTYPVAIGLNNNILYGVGLKQRVLDWHFFTSKDADQTFNRINDFRTQMSQDSVILQVAEVYYAILTLQGQKEIINWHKSVLDKAAIIVKKRIDNQMVDPLEGVQIELNQAELGLKEQMLAGGITKRLAQLKNLCGIENDDVLLLSPSKNDTIPNAALLLTNDTDYDRNAALDLMDELSKAKALEKNSIKATFAPTIDLTLNLGWQGQSENLDFFSKEAYNTNISTLGLQLDVPIYQGNDKKRKLQINKLEQEMISQRRQLMVNGFSQYRNNAKIDLEQSLALYEHQVKVLELSEKFFAGTQARFDKQVDSIKELMAAGTKVSEEKDELKKRLYDLKIKEIQYSYWTNQL